MSDTDTSTAARLARAEAIASAQREIAESERAEPIRRQILELLSSGPQRPSEIRSSTGKDQATVSRALRSLREQGLVVFSAGFDDGRRRTYVLTDEGIRQLSRHRTFAPRSGDAQTPDREAAIAYLEAALERAVSIRREFNGLADAVERIRAIRVQASKYSPELELECATELATTLRQQQSLDEVEEILAHLEDIEFGRGPDPIAPLAMPASAHRNYALGRLGVRPWAAATSAEEREAVLETRKQHLEFAFAQYRALADERGDSRWQRRAAWSHVSVADIHRERSHPEDAIKCSIEALPLFEQAQDEYGQSRCYFVIGFGARLMGCYAAAWPYLEQAHAIAERNGYRRFIADTCLQMGEVLRCQETIDEARGYIDEALEESGRMELQVTHAFALAADGALAYQADDLGRARDRLRQAIAAFELLHQHQQGLALSVRRLAVVERAIAAESRRTSAASSLAHRARSIYWNLGSPAGAMACEIELGRVEARRRRNWSPEKLVDSLDYFEEHEHSLMDLLEFDPWVPRVLHEFAQELSFEPFAARTQGVVTAGWRSLYDKFQRYLEKHLAATFPYVESDAAFASGAPFAGAVGRADEMAGESRVYLPASQLLLARGA